MPLQAHVDYLENKLKSFPTTAAKDDNLLSARKSKLTWLDRRIIEFRKERKWTMQHWAKILRERAKTAYSLLELSDIEANHNFQHTEL